MSLPSTAPSERYGCPQCLSVFRAGFARCPLDGAALQGLTGDPLIGHTLAERYIIEELLGEGGMGRVYRARHNRMSRRFAVKVLFGDMAADAKARTRFSREAEAVSRLNHPNVLSVVDFGETDEGLLYLVMDYIEGRELHQLLAQEAPLSPQRVIALLRQLTRGLAHAHERNLVHRDFKTENVVVTKSGDEELARIVDFGIAAVGEMMEPAQRLTTEGMVLGTPAYMSPEQSTGEEVDERSDLFSLGVMLYEMLCGRLPFDGTAVAIAKAHLAAEVPPVGVRVPGLRVDPRLEAVALRLMAKDPEDRFQSARALLAHLDSAFGRADSQSDGEEHDATVQVGPDAPPSPSVEQFRLTPYEMTEIATSGPTSRVRDPRWIITGVAVTLTLAAIVIALVARGDGSNGKRLPAVAERSAPAVSAPSPEPTSRPEPSTSIAPPAPEPSPAVPPEPASTAEPRPIEVEPEPAPRAAEPEPKQSDEDRESDEDRDARRERSRSRKESRARSARKSAEERSRDSSQDRPSAPRAEPRPVEPRPAPAPAEATASVAAPTAPAAEEVVSAKEFLARHKQVGRDLQRLSRKRGDAAIEQLRLKYQEIAVLDAVRSEPVRRDADRTLRGLSARIQRELAKP